MTALRSKLVLLIGMLISNSFLYSISNLNNNDPFPIFTTIDPHYFLNVNRKNWVKGYECPRPPEIMRLSFSGFRQSATCGRAVHPNAGFNCDLNPPDDFVPLGNLKGRWNMLGLFYPTTNPDGTLNFSNEQLLLTSLNITSTTCFNPNGTNLADPSQMDVTRHFGFFNVPIKYRKVGLRFELDLELYWGFFLKIQGGVADLRQTVSFVDLTCSATGLSCPVPACLPPESCPNQVPPGDTCAMDSCCIDIFTCDCKTLVIDKIMKQRDLVAEIIGVNIRDYHKTALEDTRVELFWRHMWEINKSKPGWPYFIITPWAALEMSAPTGTTACPTQLFALSTGNNGHWAWGAQAGTTIDFAETVELAFETCVTAFNCKKYCNVPVPTNQFQAGIFDTFATLGIKPGVNWYIAATLSAYHFLDRLSFYFQYFFITHDKDCFSVFSTTAPTPGNVLVSKMREESDWQVQLANVALNYDISPNIALGFLWQAPIKQRNAYRSTTIMGSIVINY